MVEFQALEVGLKLPDLSAIGVHHVVLDVARLIDLVDDDVGLVIGTDPLDPKGYGDMQSMN
jgi:hypothetical protein